MTAHVAPIGIIILFLLAGTLALNRTIRPKIRNDLCLPYDERVNDLNERVLFDFHNGHLVKVMKSRGNNGCCCAHFVLLCVRGVRYLATGRLKDGLNVCIDDECCLSTILEQVKFDLRLF